jgi:chromosome segregation ATPase
MDMDMTTQMNALKGRVAELEGALASADAEMQEVVGRMSAAQIEVMQLQEQREEAVRETRRLQRVLEEERVKVFEGRWRSLSTEVR